MFDTTVLHDRNWLRGRLVASWAWGWSGSLGAVLVFYPDRCVGVELHGGWVWAEIAVVLNRRAHREMHENAEREIGDRHG